MNTLPRSIGAHLGLLSMATSVLFSTTPAAFASTGTLNVNLSVTVTEEFEFSVTGSSPADTATANAASTYTDTLATQSFGSLAAGGAPVYVTPSFKVVSNNSKGYDVFIDGTYGSCSTTIMCSGTNTLLDAAPEFNGGTPPTGTTLVVGEGLGFRVPALDFVATGATRPTASFGTDDTAPNRLFVGIPDTSEKLFGKTGVTRSSALGGDTFKVEFGLAVPSFQATGTYTTGTIIFTAINKP